MIKSLFSIFSTGSCLLLLSPANAQYFYNAWYYNESLVWEAGLGTGIINCLTDIGGRKGNGGKFMKDIQWKSSGACFDVYLSATYKDLLGLRLQLQTGEISAGDSSLKQSDPAMTGRYGRNLSFKSRINELQLLAEFHPLFLRINEQDKIPYWSPYLVAGLSYFSFNPQAFFHGRWHDLQPLRLEGQGFREYPERRPYKLGQFSLPIGTGLRYEAGPLVNIRLEIIYHVLFTDYLDDVSTDYIDPSLFSRYLEPGPAALARQLYNRMDEIRPGGPPPPGTSRGNKEHNDAYFTI